VTGTSLRGAVVMLADGPARAPLHFTGDKISAAPATDAANVELPGHLVFPGLINAHDHLQVNAVPPLRAGAPFPNSYAWAQAFGAHFRHPEVAAAVAVPAATRCWQGGLKNLLAGTTTVAHHDPWDAALDDPDFPVRLLRRFGWSHSLGQAPREGLPGKVLDRLAGFLGRAATYGPPVVESFRATAPGAPFMIHLAEGTDAIARGELARLDALGCLAANTIVVHGVGLSRDDIDRIVARGAGVVWCPSSNLALLGTTLAPRRLFDAGRLALGTDSRLSGGRDLLDELGGAVALGELTPAELLRLVTADAARLLAIPEAGGLAPGQSADAVIVRDDGGAPASVLVTTRRADLRAVVRDGRPVLGDPDLASWFAAAGVEVVAVTLDGHPKLLARAHAREAAVALEPGLALTRP
jgi:cytosine/adenosine deaminase-related metal-dependent hydrolase